ncbi:putative diacylglycerol kinase [Desulfosarcina variabilis str. Montpellier]|uniref:diacylglycerol/lipid kinase family protein n=1 Tax=Desulfosarcina variabilis TaxID=2300 RepID=UPI003AFA8C7D
MSDNTRYCIIANPASGPYPPEQRRRLLTAVGDVLKAKIVGLDTTSSDALAGVARKASRQSDVLVVAGGDGTFSLVLNAVDLSQTTLAFLPFGTGNALTHTLAYRGDPLAIAERIRKGLVYPYDLIDCDGRKKAFMVSLGIDGTAIRLYEHYRDMGYRGFKAHLRAGLVAFFRDYQASGAWISTDGKKRRAERLLSFMVVKQPYFGMGLKAVPRARWDDGHLHTQLIASGAVGALMGLLTGFTIGNRAGEYRAGQHVSVRLDTPVTVQIDGELGWTSDRFGFRVLPGVLRLKH